MQEFVLIVSDKRKMALSYSTALIRSFRASQLGASASVFRGVLQLTARDQP